MPRRRPEQWTTSEVAAYLGYTSSNYRSTVHTQLARWGVRATARQPGRAGENLWPADQVRKAHAQRTGQGRRTDLHPRQENPE